jgi:NTE family protein
MNQPTRRQLFNRAAAGSAGLLAANILPTTPALAAEPSKATYDPQAMAADISSELFASDGLARPLPAKPTPSNLAQNIDRSLVLGGGGEYYVAWYCGFFHGLYEQGVDLNIAEMVVGTSAGAYAGSSLTSGHFQALREKFDFFGYFPTLFSKIAPSAVPISASFAPRGLISASKTATRTRSAPSATLPWPRIITLMAMASTD